MFNVSALHFAMSDGGDLVVEQKKGNYFVETNNHLPITSFGSELNGSDLAFVLKWTYNAGYDKAMENIRKQLGVDKEIEKKLEEYDNSLHISELDSY